MLVRAFLSSSGAAAGMQQVCTAGDYTPVRPRAVTMGPPWYALAMLDRLREILAASPHSAWLFCDFRHSNPIAYRALGLDPSRVATRRWYYLLTELGEPQKLVSAIEPDSLDNLPGATHIYHTWQEREAMLAAILRGHSAVAMEYSPRNAIPYVAKVDAGTVELVRSFGVEVASSADLVQQAVACWSEQQIADHRQAASLLMTLKDEAFALVRQEVLAGREINEYQLQQWMVDWMTGHGLELDHPPIVAANASNPHYEPAPGHSALIRPGDTLLLDFWAKRATPDAVYADFTWMAYLGESVPARQAEIFAIVAAARDAAIALVQDAAASGRRIPGYQADDAARDVIARAGYADYFIHRTGHNIGREVHGEGANLDNLETHDERLLLPMTCFSVEPGIYLPDFGVRSEVDVLLLPDRAEVSGEIQRAMLPLLADS